MTEQLDDFCVWARPCNGTYLNPSAFNALEVWKAAQAAMPAAPAAQWISVTDRLPKPGEEVLVWPRPRPDCAVAEYHGGAGFGYLIRKLNQGGKTYRPCDPAHWMPLPAGLGDAP